MRDIQDMDYHPISEKLTQILCEKTQVDNALFFRVLIAYYFAKVASMMRINIDTHDRGVLPVNLYAINLSPSGTGKGHSTNILEERLLGPFRSNFLEHTFPLKAEENLAKVANRRAIRKQSDPDDELERVRREFDALGALAFSFDSGTPAAVKQMRHKLLMADAGSMNLEIDEIGSNLLGQVDILNVFLELYDVGKVKQKLTKNTSENIRNEEIDGKTPTNLLLFGTPAKLLNGSRIEDEFYSFLETGYARRCLFGYARESQQILDMSPEEVYDLMTKADTDVFLDKWADKLAELANVINFGKTLTMTKEVAVTIIAYHMHCKRKAAELGEFDEIRKAEITHRYFKAMKLAGAYAFIDGSHEITEDHFYYAVKLVEDSGKALDTLLARDRPYAKLAKYIASVNREVTQADLAEDLPFFKGGNAQKQEMLTMAMAWGYRNNIIIKKLYQEGIEFLKGESLQQTDLKRMKVAYSDHVAYGYRNEDVPFDDLYKLTQASGYHWVAHQVLDGHRCEENVLPGFNMIVIDVDGGVSLDTAKLLLKEYKALYYTTKRHTDQENRFRVILPINYVLKLDGPDFKEFMANIFEWLPFEADTATGQRARKWLSHNGQYHYNDGELLDAVQFIPKTSRNEQRKARSLDLRNLGNLERWFITNTGLGNRSNQLVKYALLLVDTGKDWNEVRSLVLDLNGKLADKLDEAEIMGTVMVTVGKAIAQRDSQAAA